MASILRPWIFSVAEKELLSAYDCFEGSYIPGKIISKGHRKCSTKFVTVGLRAEKRVQVVEFDNSGRRPLGATLSDGSSLIRATFSEAATNSFKNQHSREICGIRGGLLVLTFFGHKLTQSSTFKLDVPPSRCLLLEVSEFKYSEPERSANFGRPLDILQNDAINDALGKLQALISGTPNDLTDTELSPIRSQAGSLSGRSSPEPISQANFSTQVYQPAHNNPGRRAGESSKPVNGNKNLLAILRSDISSDHGINTSSRKSILAPLTKGKIAESTSRLESRANSQPQSSSSTRPTSSPKTRKSHVTKMPAHDESSSNEADSGKENNHESQKSMDQLLRSSTTKPQPLVTGVEPDLQVAPTLFFDQFQENEPFKGAKRVPRRHVRIPAAQQGLLDHDDAWCEPHESGRPRYAKIPRQVQVGLTEFLNRRLPPTTSDSESEESESDASIPDGEDGNDNRSSVKNQGTISNSRDLRALDMRGDGVSNIKKQPQSPVKTSQYSIDDSGVEELESDDDIDDQVSWASSPPGSVDPRAGTATEDFDDVQGSFPSSPLRLTEKSNLFPELSKTVESPPQPLPHSGEAKPYFRPRNLPNFPSSSPTGEDELEIASPYAVGDEVEEEDMHEGNKMGPPVSQNQPSTAPQSSRSVQVQRTPHQTSIGHSETPPERRERKSVQEVKLTSGYVFSDEMVPATYDSTISRTLEPATGTERLSNSNYFSISKDKEVDLDFTNGNHMDLHCHISDQDEDNFEDALAEQQLQGDNLPPLIATKGLLPPPSMAQAHSPLDLPVNEKVSKSREATPNGSVAAKTPPTFFEPSSPPIQNTRSGLADGMQVSTTQMLPVNPLKRTLESRGSPESLAAKRARLRVARLIEKDDSPPRDTIEMARLSRHSFNRPMNDDCWMASKKSVAPAREVINCPLRIATIRNSDPIAEDESLQPSNPVVKFAVDELTHAIERIPQSSEEFVESQHISVADCALPTGTISIPESGGLGLDGAVTGLENERPSGLCADQTLPEAEKPQSSDGYDPFIIGAPATPAVQSIDLPARHTELAPTAHFSYFTEFQAVYPDFTGSQKRFAEALAYIEWLRKGKQAVHRSLCDDFIRVYASEYIPWACQQRAEKKPALTGWEYYDEKIPAPLFQYGIITPQNLQDALASLDAQIVEQIREKFRQASKEMQQIVPFADTPVSDMSPQPRQIEEVQSPERSARLLQAASSMQNSSTSQVKFEVEIKQEAAVDLEETSLEMRSSDVEIPADLLDRSAARAPSRSREYSGHSSIVPAEPAGVSPEQSPSRQVQDLPRIVHKAREPYFETASQLQTNAMPAVQKRSSNVPRVSSPLQDQLSEPRPKSARRTLPWLTAPSSRSPPADTPYSRLKQVLPLSSKARPTERAARSFERPPPSTSMQNLTDPFMSDDMPRRSRKHVREPSPILGTTPESEPEREPSPKYRRTSKISKSATSSVRHRDSSRVPSSPASGVSSREIASVPVMDEATKVMGWMNDLLETKMKNAKTPDFKKLESKEREITKPEMKKQEARKDLVNESEAKKPAAKQDHVEKPEVKKLEAEEPTLARKSRIDELLDKKSSKGKPYVRRKDRISAGLVSGSSTPKSTPTRELGSGSGRVSAAAKGNAKQVDEPETQNWRY